MSTPPQLPAGYNFVDQSSGPPTLPKGYKMVDAGPPSGPPPPPSYLGEALGGLGRAAHGLFVDLPSQLYQYNKNLPGGIAQGIAQDLWKGVTQSGQASQQAKQSGEGAAGQTLAALENYPVIGGMVQKAEEAGPGYAKFAPQTLGAATEAVATLEGPKLLAEGVGALPKALNEALPSRVRAGQGIAILKDRLGDINTQGVQARSYTEANKLLNQLESTKQTVPGPLRAFVDGVNKGSVDFDAALQSMRDSDPEFAEKVERKLAQERSLAQLEPSQEGTVNPNTFRGLAEFKTIFNELKYDSSLKPRVQAQLGQIAKYMDDETRSIAANNGYGNLWDRFQKEYSQAKQITRLAKNPITRHVTGAVGGGLGATAGAATGIPHAALAGGGLGYSLGATVPEAIATRIVERKAGIPTLPPSPEAYAQVLANAAIKKAAKYPPAPMPVLPNE